VSGGQGTTGQVLKSQGTGQPSTWGSVDAITNYAYESRGSLRGTTPTDGSQAYVSGLGYFVFELSSTEPDDDETAFRTATGAWILTAPTWDTIQAYEQFERLGRNYSVLVDNTIQNWQGGNTYQYANIPGASPGDFYTVQPYPITACLCCGYYGQASAYYDSAKGCVIILGSLPCVAICVAVSCGSVYTQCAYVCGNFSCVCKWNVYVEKV